MSDLVKRLRDDPGLADCEEAANRIEALAAERDAIKATLTYCENQWAETDRETLAKMLAERKRADSAEAENERLRDAVYEIGKQAADRARTALNAKTPPG